MRFAAALAVLLVAVLVSGAPALAQLAPERQLGSNIYAKPDSADQQVSADMRLDFQRCYYQRERSKIETLLRRSGPMKVDFEGSGIDQRRFFGRSKVNPCLTIYDNYVARRTISFSPRTFRYMMLEEAYLRRFPQARLVGTGATSPEVGRNYVSEENDLANAQGLAAFADCIAATDPLGADRILRTSPGSAAEHSAATSLVPALSACIIEGQQDELRPENIRAFAADGLWQRFVAHSAEPASES